MKIRKIANREKIREKERNKQKVERKLAAEKRSKQREFKRGIKQALGFDKLKIKGRKASLDFFEDNSGSMVDWNGVPW